MNKLQLFAIIFFLGGIILLIHGALSGDITAGVFFIFPYLISRNVIPVVGGIFLFFSIVLYMLSTSYHIYDGPHEEKDDYLHDDKKKKRSISGGVIMIGPVPIVFGSNWKIALLLLLVSLLFIILVSVLFSRF